MNREEKFKTRLGRIEKWVTRADRIIGTMIQEVEGDYRKLLKEWDEEKSQFEESSRQKEEELRGRLAVSNAEFARQKYMFEKESYAAKSDIAGLEEEISRVRNQFEKDMAQLGETQVKIQASHARQKSALEDLYKEKMHQLVHQRARLVEDLQHARENYRLKKLEVAKEITDFTKTNREIISSLENEKAAKQNGWEMAIDVLKRQLEVLNQERDDLKKRMINLHDQTEKEMESLRQSMAISKEQLEIDKATLIEKAEEEERQCKADVKDLEEKVRVAETELQRLIVEKEDKIKQEEEILQKEEHALKEAVQTESDKRDYEQRLFEQEKIQKEKEVNNLKEEYDKKKWYWDNQIRNLMMKKGVQDSESEAERLRVNREARGLLKTLENRRDELKQRLAELKSRHDHVGAQAEKEKGLLRERWQWRKDRFWSMLQGRLEVLKKERASLHEQINAVEENFSHERLRVVEDENKANHRIDDLHQMILHISDQNLGQKKQQEIQNELEKTRLLTQIKECETLVGDWLDRLKVVQNETIKGAQGFGEQLGFLERLYQEEERETTLFLKELNRIMAFLINQVDQVFNAKDAA